jgi:DNA repair exonuclease SbcCD ATPase subunit
MKNIPSFNEFKKYEDLLEKADRSLVQELVNIEKADPYHSVNEGHVMNVLKNTLSKFFLGSMSKITMLDEARKIILDLELDIVERKDQFEKDIEKLDVQISELSKIGEKEKIVALEKERESKAREIETYLKAQKLKIRKSKEVANKLVDNNPRRREYLEAGYSEDAIAIAELEYELAKDRAEDQTKLRDYLERIKKAKEDAEAKARDLNAKTEKEANKDKEEAKEDISVDPEKEKRKIASRKGKDLIQRKNELEKEIVDIRSDIERKLSQFEAKVIKNPKSINGKYIEKIKIELLEMSSALDAKENLLKAFRELGKGEDEITKVLSKESDFTKLANKINQGILDGADANSGTKKIISDLFSTIGSGATPSVSPQNIKNAKSKLNK